MKLDDLYKRVTDAISRAESLEAEGRTRDAAMAYQEVSSIEEEITELLPASDPEGALARQGVVTAALSAGNLTRAIERARAYSAANELSAPFRDELAALEREAQAALRAQSGTRQASSGPR